MNTLERSVFSIYLMPLSKRTRPLSKQVQDPFVLMKSGTMVLGRDLILTL